MISRNQIVYFYYVLLFFCIFRGNVLSKDLGQEKNIKTKISQEQIKDAEMMIDQSTNHTKQGLGKLFDKIDVNHDLLLVKDELINWIIQYNEVIMMEEAKTEIERFDKDRDNELSWEEYMLGQYGNLSMEAIKNDSDHNDIIEFVTDDKFRFGVADSDKNGKLMINEIKAFLRPHNHVEMLDYEVHRALVDYDKNKDQSITKSEFIETQYGKDKMNVYQHNYVKKIFDSYDKDKNEQLSSSEIKVWLKPDITDYAETEAQYLMKTTDENGDKKLTKEEVLNKFDHWINSKATNYGADLRQEL